jgi:WD40 repeat protein
MRAAYQGLCVVCAMQRHNGWVQCVSWSPDARMVATGATDNNLFLWDAKSGDVLGACKGTTQNTALGFCCPHVLS